MASIEQRSSGWRVIWRYSGRKQTTIAWPDYDQAVQAQQIAEAHHHKIEGRQVEVAILGKDSETQEPATASLREWCETFLGAKTRITPRTRRDYKRLLNLRILPELGDIPVNLITPTDIGTLLNRISAGGLENATVTRYYSVLHVALEGAVKEGLMPENPCAGTDFVRNQVADDDTGEEQRVYLTPEQYHILRAAFTAEAQLVIDVLAGTGARWSEATALAVEHLVAPTAKEGPKLRIWRAWKQAEDSSWYLGTTKRRQKRTIGISVELYGKLAEAAKDKPSGAFLVTAPGGGRILYANFYNRAWKPALVRAQRCNVHPPTSEAEWRAGATGRCSDFGGRRSSGRPCRAEVVAGTTRCRSHSGPARNAVSSCECDDVLHVRPTPHHLRHSHAAWLFADPTVPPIAISRRLGHANLQTTGEIYGGLMPTAAEAAVDAISAVLASPKPARTRRHAVDPRQQAEDTGGSAQRSTHRATYREQ